MEGTPRVGARGKARAGTIAGIAHGGEPASVGWRFALVAAGVLAGLLTGEILFRTAIPSRDLSATTLWRDQCWRTDASGFREQPTTNSSMAPTRVLVLGDSFAAGLGICNPRDAFPWLLADQLERTAPGAFRVSVAARPGLDTRDELDILRRLPQPPHVLVLSYFGNDIDSAVREAGIPDPPQVVMYAGLSPPARAVVTTSRLANYAYWSFSRVDYAPILHHYREVWSRGDIVRAHLRELDDFLLPGVTLIVVVFPYLPDPGVSNYAQVVAEHMRARGADVISVDELSADLPISARVVGPNDVHASAEVHQRVGLVLAQKIRTLALKSPPAGAEPPR
jgi:lysophospholipase L1-like esterase